MYLPDLQLKGTMSPVENGGLPLITAGVAVVSACCTVVVMSLQPPHRFVTINLSVSLM